MTHKKDLNKDEYSYPIPFAGLYIFSFHLRLCGVTCNCLTYFCVESFAETEQKDKN